jgi:DNA-binding MarR family transcriptional regulator
MTDDDVALSEAILRSFGAVTKGLRQWVRSHMGAEPGMTVGRAGLLLGLLEQGQPVSMTALGAARDQTPRAMTVLVHGLEKEGLISRTQDADDRRVMLLSLTPAGHAVASRQLLPAAQQAAALFGELPEHDRTELLRLLGEVAKHLELHGIETPLLPAAARHTAPTGSRLAKPGSPHPDRDGQTELHR